MEPFDLLKASAAATAGFVETERFTKMSMNAMKLVGTEMLPHLTQDDAAGLFVPVEFEESGKELDGAILTLQDRAIFAWITGTFRIKNFESIVPFASITQVERTTRPASKMRVERTVLQVSADRRWTILFSNLFEGGRPIAPFLEVVLNGSAAFEHDGNGKSGFSLQLDTEHPNAP